METTSLVELINSYKHDSESVYNTWFVGGEERMKAFRSIRRGVRDTVDAIAAGTFGNDFKGSQLETTPIEAVLTGFSKPSASATNSPTISTSSTRSPIRASRHRARTKPRVCV